MNTELPPHVLLAIADMNRAVARMNFETAAANRELQQFAEWQCDHPAAMREHEIEFNNARATVANYSQYGL
jgi:hypothetical protein